MNITSIIERLQTKLPPSININRDVVIENIWRALKLIGMKQTDEYYLIKAIDSTQKIKLPEWLDSIEKVVWVSQDYRIDEIETNILDFSSRALLVPRTEELITERDMYSYQYLIRGNYLYTNAKVGYFIIIYNSIPIDELGEPLIPEEIQLIEALVWFNVKELLWQLTVRNPGQYSGLFQKAEQEWGYYSINAKTASIFPKNEDVKYYLQNKYLKLLPNFTK
mgnify:CR=1 FL=1